VEVAASAATMLDVWSEGLARPRIVVPGTTSPAAVCNGLDEFVGASRCSHPHRAVPRSWRRETVHTST
jgi:hypothetical protein